MLHIGICEDDWELSRQLQSLLVKYLFAYTDMEFACYVDGQQVIDSVLNKKFNLDLLLLDIHMGDVNGLQVAAYLRQQGVDTDIIFVTVSKEHVFEGYTYKAFAYWLKPLNETVMKRDLERYMNEKETCDACFHIPVRGCEQRIPLQCIVYFESSGHKILIHTVKDEELTFYGKLNEVEKIVDASQFFRCHQSYLVNRSMIESFSRIAMVVHGCPVPISRKYYTEWIAQDCAKATMRVTHSLAMNREESGAIVFISGMLLGTMIRIQEESEIYIGRDATQSDIVLRDKAISRRHCCIVYHGEKQGYSICDYSHNGVYLSDGTKLPKNEKLYFSQGEELWIGSAENRICLG